MFKCIYGFCFTAFILFPGICQAENPVRYLTLINVKDPMLQIQIDLTQVEDSEGLNRQVLGYVVAYQKGKTFEKIGILYETQVLNFHWEFENQHRQKKIKKAMVQGGDAYWITEKEYLKSIDFLKEMIQFHKQRRECLQSTEKKEACIK